MAGQGTLGLEIVEQVPNIDAVVIPIGGGGLIAGVALAVKSLHPGVMIIVSEILLLFFSTDNDICTRFSLNFHRASSRRCVQASTGRGKRVGRRTHP